MATGLLQLFQTAAAEADEAMGAGAEMDFAVLGRLCDAFAQEPQAEREGLPPADGWLRVALLSYAWHCAEAAVTRRDPHWIARGLIALVIEGGSDPRDNIMRMAVLFHSANLLGLDAAQLFSDAAALRAGHRIAGEMAGFLSRPEKGLETFAIRIDEAEGAFHYRYEGGAERAVKAGWFRRRK